MAFIIATTLAIWKERFIKDMTLHIANGIVYMHCDNWSTIRLIKGGPNSSKGKHIDGDYHYIKDVVERNEVTVSLLPSVDIVADPLTRE